jgi:hypothetical protein
LTVKDAVQQIKQSLLTINNSQTELNVVVIDTCGEHNSNSNTFFEVNFDGWKKFNFWPNLNRSNLSGYFAWSLRNVLLRTTPDENSNYFLNPVKAGVDTCLTVHKKKAIALFGKKAYVIPALSGSAEQMISILDEKANEYGQMLSTKMPQVEELEKFLKSTGIKA